MMSRASPHGVLSKRPATETVACTFGGPTGTGLRALPSQAVAGAGPVSGSHCGVHCVCVAGGRIAHIACTAIAGGDIEVQDLVFQYQMRSKQVLTSLPSPPPDLLTSLPSFLPLLLHCPSALRLRRPPAQVLRSVSLTVKAGTVCALVGRSGSGKSTLVHMLMRFYAPTGGHQPATPRHAPPSPLTLSCRPGCCRKTRRRGGRTLSAARSRGSWCPRRAARALAGGRVLLDGVPIDTIAMRAYHGVTSLVAQVRPNTCRQTSSAPRQMRHFTAEPRCSS